MQDKKWVDIRVSCPRDSLKVEPEKMQMRFVRTDGTWFPLPCNGCESLNGNPICYQCCAAITKLFFDDPDRDAFDVIYPKI